MEKQSVPISYSNDLTTFRKALYVLSTGKEFLPIRRIVEAIKLLEDRQHDHEYDTKLNRNLSRSLITYERKGILIQKLRLGGEYMYGLKAWHEKLPE